MKFPKRFSFLENEIFVWKTITFFWRREGEGGRGEAKMNLPSVHSVEHQEQSNPLPRVVSQELGRRRRHTSCLTPCHAHCKCWDGFPQGPILCVGPFLRDIWFRPDRCATLHAPDCPTSAPSPRCSSVESRLCSMLSSCFGANGSRRL